MKLKTCPLYSFCFTIVFLFFWNISTFAAEQKCPESINNSYECAQYLEKKLNKKYPKLFSRNERKLTANLSALKQKTYIDSINDDVNGKWYSFVLYYPEIGFGLIEVQFYEGGTSYLLNLKTGKDFEIGGHPTISPDRRRIAVSNVDLESQYTPNILAVYEIKGDALITIFEEMPDNWGAGNVQWINNNDLSFTKYSLDSQLNTRKELKKLKKRVQDKTGKQVWIIE